MELTFSVSDTTFGEVIRRKLDADFVARDDTDEVFAHPSCDVRHDFITGFQLDSEPSVCEGLRNSTLDLESFFFFTQEFIQRLSFAELDAATGTTQTRLLSFLHAGIAGQEATIAKCVMECFVKTDQCTGQSHADGTALAGQAATADADDHVNFVSQLNSGQRFDHGLLVLVVHKVLVEWTPVDGDFAIALANTDASDAAFASAGTQRIAVNFVFFDQGHQYSSSKR